MKVCPGCGREERDVPFVGFLCIDCYRKRNKLVTVKDITVKRCPRCGRIYTRRWEQFSLENLKKYVEGKVTTSLSNAYICISFRESKGRIYAIIKVCGDLYGERVCEDEEKEIRIVREVCPFCTRESGGYFEAVIQVRGSDVIGVSDRLISMIRKEGSFTSKLVRRKEGIDIYVGSRKVAEKVAKRTAKILGGSVKRTFSVFGEKNGKKLVRITICLRIP